MTFIMHRTRNWGNLDKTLQLSTGPAYSRDNNKAPAPPPPTPDPPAGTELNRECDGFDLVLTIADGNGGSTEERTPDSPECGYVPPPPPPDPLQPTFGAVTSLANGFSVQVTNYDGEYAWTVFVVSGTGNPTISASGLVSVTGMADSATATVKVDTAKDGLFGSSFIQGAASAP